MALSDQVQHPDLEIITNCGSFWIAKLESEGILLNELQDSGQAGVQDANECLSKVNRQVKSLFTSSRGNKVLVVTSLLAPLTKESIVSHLMSTVPKGALLAGQFFTGRMYFELPIIGTQEVYNSLTEIAEQSTKRFGLPFEFKPKLFNTLEEVIEFKHTLDKK